MHELLARLPQLFQPYSVHFSKSACCPDATDLFSLPTERVQIDTMTQPTW